MPIYEYRARDKHKSCEHCVNGFEVMQNLSDRILTECPKCKSPVVKLISSASVGSSKSGLYSRARSAGFTTLKKTSGGGYEKMK
jgi:putative FmdB family regulatory protein